MGNLKSGFRSIIFAFAILFISCSEDTKRNIYFALDMAGVLIPSETRIDLPFNKEHIEKIFSFQDYYKEECDSLFLVYPYFNTKCKDFLSIRMSNILRRKCDNNTNFDSFSTLLFIKGNTVKVYSIIESVDADFDSKEVEKHYIFPIDQKFIIDKEKNIHLYKG